MDHALRRQRAADAVTPRGLDALLVWHLPNVRYLSGFSGSSGVLVLGGQAAVLVIDGRYSEQAAREAPDVERRTSPDGYTAAALEAATAFGRRIGFEADAIRFSEWERLRDAGPRLELVATTGIVEALRAVKDAEEQALIAAAQGAADLAFDDVLMGGGLREGAAERDVALALEVAMRRAGAEALAFEPIVAFGENGAEPHHRPSGRELRRGDLVTADFGAAIGGYRSDMTRTIAFGDPSPRLREVYDVVAAAQATGVAAVSDGVVAADVDAAARGVIAEAGYADAFAHPVGHGVGLEIHEAPIMRASCRSVLRVGAVVTVEPGVYLAGVGGVRIEDTVEITTGGRRVVPRTTKELIVL